MAAYTSFNNIGDYVFLLTFLKDYHFQYFMGLERFNWYLSMWSVPPKHHFYSAGTLIIKTQSGTATHFLIYSV